MNAAELFALIREHASPELDPLLAELERRFLAKQAECLALRVVVDELREGVLVVRG